MSRKAIIWSYLGLLLYTAGPILCVLIASGIASATGCQLDEGSVHPCVVLGCDIGEFLYSLAMMGWLGLLTLPTGTLGLFVFTIVVLVRRKSAGRTGRLET